MDRGEAVPEMSGRGVPLDENDESLRLFDPPTGGLSAKVWAQRERRRLARQIKRRCTGEQSDPSGFSR